MIPLKLSLKNFLCYRGEAPTLDLSGIHVACVSGSNGHGKSALLDSITWALWGEARGKSQDDLLHFGEDEMWVELEFRARNRDYKVVRRHRRGGLRARRGASGLELQIRGGDGFLPITGNTMTETKAMIEDILGMDYNTFINSAFLIQGRADEFTNKTPSERKEVLGKIIGLGRYAALQERSRRKAQERERSGNDVEAAFQYLREEIAREPGLRQELQEADKSLDAVIESLSVKSREAEDLREQVQSLELKTHESRDIQARLPGVRSDIDRYRREALAKASLVDECLSLVDRRLAIEEGSRRYEEARRENEGLNRARAQYDELKGKETSLLRVIDRAKAQVDERTRTLKRRLESDLAPKSQRAPGLEGQLAEERRAAASLSQEEESLSRERAQLEGLAAREGELAAVLAPLKVEGEELKKKLELLGVSRQEARCPLCGSSLGEEGCERLSESYDLQIKEKRQQYVSNQAALKDAKAQRESLAAKVSGGEKALRRRQQATQGRTARLERDLEESHKAAEEAQRVKADLAKLEGQAAGSQFAAEEQSALKEVVARMERLGYSPERHRELGAELHALQAYQVKRQQLEAAIQRLPQEKSALAEAKKMEGRRGEELAAMEERLALLKSEIGGLPALKSRLEAAQREQGRLEADRQRLLVRRGGLQEGLQRIEGHRREMTRRTRELKALREEQAIFEELREAFGRQGVQALLIEILLPQIEERANNLLGRMTDDRMTVKLETQRELISRRGEYRETLDIEISDELGSRSYEMFSGGEAFRVNLALRIALSQALADRSGAPLPTLFIDEGFGTQDAAGQERVLDVIQAIRDDFKQILVITHLEQMKEAFPVRIEVEKLDGASTCWIS